MFTNLERWYERILGRIEFALKILPIYILKRNISSALIIFRTLVLKKSEFSYKKFPIKSIINEKLQINCISSGESSDDSH